MATALRITDGSDAVDFRQADPKQHDPGIVAVVDTTDADPDVQMTRQDLVHLRDWAVAVLADLDAHTPRPRITGSDRP